MGEILHHFPLDSGNDLERQGVKNEMEFTVEQLRKIYGDDISPVWMTDVDIESSLICWGGSGCGSRTTDVALITNALFEHDVRSLEPDFHQQCKKQLAHIV